MFSLKHLIGLALTSLVFVSCSPYPPVNGPRKPAPNGANVPDATQVEKEKTPEELKQEAARIKANKEAAARRAALKKKKEEEGSDTITPPDVAKKDPVKPKSKYRTAVAIPGKPGFVFNPWTNKAVDVRGVPGGMLVRDPNDGNPDHKFRVP